MSRMGTRQTVVVILIALIAVLLLTVGVLFFKYNKLKNDPKSTAKNDTTLVIKEVGDIYELPTNEEPTVAKIQDKQKLKDQAFFDKSQNGDYLLVYTKNKLALIYRSTTNKLINVGPINLNNSSSAQATDQTAKDKP